jgi:ABC-type multidrug transport system fused ATPase/permease subunit
VRDALRLLSRRDRRLLGIAIAIQMATSLLDLVGILLIGLVGALAVTIVQSQPAPEAVTRVADAVGLGDLSDQALVAVLAGAAAALLLSKSIVSSLLTRRVFIFLANRQALVSARLSKELLSRPLTTLQGRSSQETAFALIYGAGAATIQILGQLSIAVTELSLLFVLGAALLVISPWVAVGAIAFFALLAVGLQWAMGGWAARLGASQARADISSLNAIQEALSAYREITVADRRMLYVDRIQELRWQAARVAADSQFLSMFPKYVFEAALVVGGFALAGVLLATQDSVTAIGTLALFLAAATRVMPSLLRLQGSALGLRSASGIAAPTFELAAELGHPLETVSDVQDVVAIRERIRRGNPDFVPTISLDRVTVTYLGANRPSLIEATLRVEAGQTVALVGRSGAGKSTMADVILGIIQPDIGSAIIGGRSPAESISLWPGGLAYVPQHVVLANDTVRANVALGLPSDAIDDELVWRALEQAHLATELRAQRAGLDTLIGEHGVRLSGGQKQRLGIARALYTRPRLLVLDEATSALDAETEQAVSLMLGELDKDVTTIIVAHRLSTVRDVDLVVYLDGGRIAASGSFDDVASAVPAFARQANLMGLT